MILLTRNMNYDVIKNTLARNTLERFGGFCPGDACFAESAFVNHVALVFRISLFQGVSKGRRCGVPT